MSNDPSPAQLPECCRDLLSVGGLRRLGREDPDWRDRLHRAFESLEVRDERQSGWTSKATLREAVLAYEDRLLPSSFGRVGIETVYRARQLARGICELAGGWDAEDAAERLDELRDLLGRPLVEGGRGLSPDRTSRSMSLVRRVLTLRRSSLGLPPLPPPQSHPPAPSRPPRTTVPLRVAAEFIRLARPGERAKLALALGAGLRPGQIDALRGHDLVAHTTSVAESNRLRVLPGIALHFVRVAVRGGRAIQWIPLPPWVTALLLDCRLGQGNRRLIPTDVAPAIAQTVRRLRKVVPGSDGVTAMSLRLTWQGLAIRAGLPRGIVRGSWRQPTAGERTWPTHWHGAQVRLWGFAAGWRELTTKLTRPFIGAVAVVARRAPSGCRPGAPERRRKKRRPPAPLPDLAAVPEPDGSVRAQLKPSMGLVPEPDPAWR